MGSGSEWKYGSYTEWEPGPRGHGAFGMLERRTTLSFFFRHAQTSEKTSRKVAQNNKRAFCGIDPPPML
jgi:hypothetical protein